jgi:hypothetical protein
MNSDPKTGKKLPVSLKKDLMYNVFTDGKKYLTLTSLKDPGQKKKMK